MAPEAVRFSEPAAGRRYTNRFSSVGLGLDAVARRVPARSLCSPLWPRTTRDCVATRPAEPRPRSGSPIRAARGMVERSSARVRFRWSQVREPRPRRPPSFPHRRDGLPARRARGGPAGLAGSGALGTSVARTGLARRVGRPRILRASCVRNPGRCQDTRERMTIERKRGTHHDHHAHETEMTNEEPHSTGQRGWTCAYPRVTIEGVCQSSVVRADRRRCSSRELPVSGRYAPTEVLIALYSSGVGSWDNSRLRGGLVARSPSPLPPRAPSRTARASVARARRGCVRRLRRRLKRVYASPLRQREGRLSTAELRWPSLPRRSRTMPDVLDLMEAERSRRSG
jgi:hypothetical protein